MPLKSIVPYTYALQHKTWTSVMLGFVMLPIDTQYQLKHNVPEVLNVHVNENKKKIYFF